MSAPTDPSSNAPAKSPADRNRMTVMLTAGAAVVMLGVAFAAKPLYDTFCRVTGFGGTTRVAEAAGGEVLDRTVQVRFDANIAGGLPFDFEPMQTSATVRVGETGLAFYRLVNTSDRPVSALATYNVTPHKAGPYFTKLECFCFEDTVYAPGEVIELPVVYFVDARVDEERRMDDLHTVTLSYTFYETDEAPTGQAPDVTAQSDQPSQLDATSQG